MSKFAMLFRFCLALILALTLSHATVASNQGGTIAGWIALCAGEDVVSVAVDSDGAPVAAHLPCPDCIMAGAVVVPADATIAAPVFLAGRIARLSGAWRAPTTFSLSPAARGPPPFA